MAWICYLPFVIHRRQFTIETAIIFVFASVSSSFRSLIDSLVCHMWFSVSELKQKICMLVLHFSAFLCNPRQNYKVTVIQGS